MSERKERTCGHLRGTFAGHQVCKHLLDLEHPDFLRYRPGLKSAPTNEDFSYRLACIACAHELETGKDILWFDICNLCFLQRDIAGVCRGHIGLPAILERSTNLQFAHHVYDLPHQHSVLTVTTLMNHPSARWVAIDQSGHVLLINPGVSSQVLTDHQTVLRALGDDVRVHASSDGRFVVVVQHHGSNGIVLDLHQNTCVMELNRGEYHTEQTEFPVALLQRQERSLLIHATNWNRLDVTDLTNGLPLTQRSFPESTTPEEQPAHYLDFFHGALRVSPSGEWIADDGWVWAPVGVVTAWNLETWLGNNVWESEDGASKKSLIWRHYHWDVPMCWLNNAEIAIWGIGDDDYWIAPGVNIVDVRTGETIRQFFGPEVREAPKITQSTKRIRPNLVFDQYLFALIPGCSLSVWDVITGEKFFADHSWGPLAYHPEDQVFWSAAESGQFRLSHLVSPDVEIT